MTHVNLLKYLVPSTLLVVCFACSAQADNLNLDLGLTTPGTFNRFNVEGTVASVSASAPSDASGNILATIDVDFNAISNEATVNSINLTGGTSDFTDFLISLFSGAQTVSSTNMQGTVGTAAPPTAVVAGAFDASAQTATLNGGTLAFAGLVNSSRDLSTNPISGPISTSGSGTIDIGSPSIVGNVATYVATLELPVDFIFTESGGTLHVTGTYQGTTSFQRTISAVPEPGSWVLALLGALFAGLYLRRRKYSR